MRWTDSSQQLNTHASACSLLPPRLDGEENRKSKSEKTHGWRWRQFNMWEKKKTCNAQAVAHHLFRADWYPASPWAVDTVERKTPCPFFPLLFQYGPRYLQTILLPCCVSTNCIMWDHPGPTRKQYPFEDIYVSSVSFPGALNTPKIKAWLGFGGFGFTT